MDANTLNEASELHSRISYLEDAIEGIKSDKGAPVSLPAQGMNVLERRAKRVALSDETHAAIKSTLLFDLENQLRDAQAKFAAL